MGGSNLVSLSLILDLAYAGIFMFPVIIISYASRKKDLPWIVFMICMVIISVIIVLKIQSYKDAMLIGLFVILILIMNGIGWLLFRLKKLFHNNEWDIHDDMKALETRNDVEKNYADRQNK